MKPEDAQRDRQALEIFDGAVEMTSAEARRGYLEGACGGDERLKARVEALLAHHVQDSFLQHPAAVLGPGANRRPNLIMILFVKSVARENALMRDGFCCLELPGRPGDNAARS